MTIIQADDSPNLSKVDETARAGTSWASHAAELAGVLASEHFNRGDLAQLRRMDPDAPDAAAFWRLMAQRELLGGPDVESKWGLILHGIALMTPTSRGEGKPSVAHDGYIPVGRALYLGGDSQRAAGFYSGTRLNRLLTARGPMLRILLARMFRMLAAASVSFNWREMASFILSEGYDDEVSENARRYIAREYYQAERRSAHTSEE